MFGSIQSPRFPLLDSLPGPRYRPLRLATQLLHALLAWQQRANERYALATMDARQLRDVGLTGQDVQAQLIKPRWRR